MNKTGKENLVMINDEEYVHCPVCGTLTAVYDILSEKKSLQNGFSISKILTSSSVILWR